MLGQQVPTALTLALPLDPTASIPAEVNNSGSVGVGYTQSLRPGVKLTPSTLVDGKSFNAGGHKLGLALELEA